MLKANAVQLFPQLSSAAISCVDSDPVRPSYNVGASPVHIVIARGLGQGLKILGHLLGGFHELFHLNRIPGCRPPCLKGRHHRAHHVPKSFQVNKLLLWA